MSVTVLADGGRNLALEIKAMANKDSTLLQVYHYKPQGRGLEHFKLASAVWLIQEKMNVSLWWDQDNFALIMESRNAVRFENGLRPPPNWDGQIFIKEDSVIKTSLYLIHLEFDK